MLQVLIQKSEFLSACVFTLKAFIEIVQFIFKIPGVKFFLNERISQDPLKNFFGCQRQRTRTADKCLPILQEHSSIRVINSVCRNISKGNCCGRAQSIVVKDDKPLSKRQRVRIKSAVNEALEAVSPSETVPPLSKTVTPSETVSPSDAVTPSETVSPSDAVTPSETVSPSDAVTPSETVSKFSVLLKAEPPSNPETVPSSLVTKSSLKAVPLSLQSGSQGEVLVNAYGITLTHQDLLSIIINSGWLNDKV